MTSHHHSPAPAIAAATATPSDADVSTAAAGDTARSADTGSRDDDRSTGHRYPGGKNAAGTYQWIINKFPTHSVYAEPFVGSGAILRRKPPALVSYALDIDPAVVDFWRRLAWPSVEVLAADGIRWLEDHAADFDPSDTVIYIDPPYPLSTRSHKRLYAQELTDADHRRLLTVVKQLPARVAVSSYPSDLYAAALADWQRFERDVITRGAVMRREVLWTNYDPAALASPLSPYYGDDFRERERVKRKARRWLKRLAQTDALERRTILLSLLEFERAEGDELYRAALKARLPLLADVL